MSQKGHHIMCTCFCEIFLDWKLLNCMEKLSCPECMPYLLASLVHIFYWINIYCWCFVRGVDILKRPARAGERPWDCFKGTSVVCVPVHYVLAYINSLEYRGEWDDLFQKGIFPKELFNKRVWRSYVQLYVKQPTCPHFTEIGNYCKGFLTWVW